MVCSSSPASPLAPVVVSISSGASVVGAGESVAASASASPAVVSISSGASVPGAGASVFTSASASSVMAFSSSAVSAFEWVVVSISDGASVEIEGSTVEGSSLSSAVVVESSFSGASVTRTEDTSSSDTVPWVIASISPSSVAVEVSTGASVTSIKASVDTSKST